MNRPRNVDSTKKPHSAELPLVGYVQVSRIEILKDQTK